MRRPLRAAATAAASSSTSVRMCKDLGALWPGCAIVKLKLHFVAYVGGTSTSSPATATAVAANWGQGRIVCNPWTPLRILAVPNWVPTGGDSGNNAGNTNTLISRNAVGYSKLIGTADPSIYKRVCTLRMQYDLKLVLVTSQAGASQPSAVLDHITAYTRPFDNTESLLAAPSSQDGVDLNITQPHVRRRHVANLARICNMNGYTAASADLPQPVIRMRGSVWPHRTCEIPWASYIGNDTSFAIAGADPSDLASLEWGFYSHSPGLNAVDQGATRGAVYLPYMQGTLVFTCLFKDPNAGLV